MKTLSMLLLFSAFSHANVCETFKESRPTFQKVTQHLKYFGSAYAVTSGFLSLNLADNQFFLLAKKYGYTKIQDPQRAAFLVQQKLESLAASSDREVVSAMMDEFQMIRIFDDPKLRQFEQTMKGIDVAIYQEAKLTFPDNNLLMEHRNFRLDVEARRLDHIMETYGSESFKGVRATVASDLRLLKLMTGLRWLAGSAIGGAAIDIGIMYFYPEKLSDRTENSVEPIIKNPAVLYSFSNKVACFYLRSYPGIEAAFKEHLGLMTEAGNFVDYIEPKLEKIEKNSNLPKNVLSDVTVLDIPVSEKIISQ